MIARIAAALMLVLPCGALAQDTGSGLTATGTTTLSAIIKQPCSLATISTTDKTVTVDWECVDKNATEYESGHFQRGSIYPAFALIMRAIRDGEAKGKTQP